MRQLLGIDPVAPDPENPDETELRPFVAVFEVREGNSNFGGLLHSYKLNGISLGGSISGGTAVMAASEITPVPDGVSLKTDVTIAKAASISGDELTFRALSTATSTPSASPSTSPSPSATNSNNYNDMQYTSDQLKDLIAEKKAEIAKKQLERKQIQLNLNKADLQLKNSTVLSKVDGTVKNLIATEDATADNKPFMVVSGENTFYLSGTLNETLLGSIGVGDEVTAYSWEAGSFTAQIVSIDDYPVENSQGYYSGTNPNSSDYAFTAVLNETEGVYNGMWFDITMSVGAESMDGMEEIGDAMYLEKMYVRDDDSGYYVMKAGSDGRLVRQNVEVGKIIYNGYYIEIKSGVTLEDYVTFPYGKEVKEGVRTRLQGSAEDEYYEGSGTVSGGDVSGGDLPANGGIIPPEDGDTDPGSGSDDTLSDPTADNFDGNGDLPDADDGGVQAEDRGIIGGDDGRAVG